MLATSLKLPGFLAEKYLGNVKQLLGDFNNIAQRLDILDSSLHSFGMALSRGVQNVLDTVDGAVSPFLVHWTTVSKDAVEDTEQAKGDNRFLVEHIKLIADGPN